MGKPKTYCKLSHIYDYRHIVKSGLNCPFKHKEYHWPACLNSNHCIVGDSIIKFLKITNQADIISLPGITIDRLFWKFQLNKISLEEYKIVIIHVGANDVREGTKSQILDRYVRLIKAVRKQNQTALVGLSSILPQPCASAGINSKIEEVNKAVKSLCGKDNLYFVPSYRPFAKSLKAGNLDLYAIDKLHLSYKGAGTLKRNLIGNIISLQAFLKPGF